MSNDDLVYQKVLYYPSFDIRNAGWLAAASLYWENVQRMVPVEIETPTWSDSFALALRQSDPTFFEEVWLNPDSPDVQWAGERLLGMIEESDADDPSPIGAALRAPGGEPFLVHKAKVEGSIYERLIEQRVIRAGPIRTGWSSTSVSGRSI